MKIKIIRSFEKDCKKYLPGEIYSISLVLARRYVSRGDAEFINEIEKVIRKPDEIEIKPKKKLKRKR